MTEKKRKERDEGNRQRLKPKKKPNTQWKKRGPRLPSSLQKQLHRLNPTTSFDSVDSDDDNDVYEYEEERAEEESKKNKRYDSASVDDDLAQEIEVFNYFSSNTNSSFELKLLFCFVSVFEASRCKLIIYHLIVKFIYFNFQLIHSIYDYVLDNSDSCVRLYF